MIKGLKEFEEINKKYFNDLLEFSICETTAEEMVNYDPYYEEYELVEVEVKYLIIHAFDKALFDEEFTNTFENFIDKYEDYIEEFNNLPEVQQYLLSKHLPAIDYKQSTKI